MAGTPIKRARHEKALAILAKPEFWEQLWEHLAEGNTLLINVPKEQFDTARLNELGWKVVPE